MIRIKEKTYINTHGHRPSGLGTWCFMDEEGKWSLKLFDTYIRASQQARRTYSKDKDTDYGIIEVQP